MKSYTASFIIAVPYLNDWVINSPSKKFLTEQDAIHWIENEVRVEILKTPLKGKLNLYENLNAVSYKKIYQDISI